jgi:hypothetical protein
VTHVRTNPASPVSQALTTPLMLSLVRDTFPDPTEVGTVLLVGRNPSRGQVEDALLDRVLPAAYAPRPGQPRPPCTLGQAQRWLGYLAARMTQDGTGDLAWWEMHRWQPMAFRIITGILVVGAVVGLVSGLAAGLATGLAAGILSGLLFGPSAGPVASRRPAPAGFDLNQLLPRHLPAIGLVVGLAYWLAYGPAATTSAGARMPSPATRSRSM